LVIRSWLRERAARPPLLGWHEALRRLFASELASIPTPDPRPASRRHRCRHCGRDLGIAVLLTAVGFLAVGIAAMLARL
jgi:hypothetical protein